MHDKNGKELAIGDTVLIAAKITQLSPGDDYCNVSVQTINGRKPDGVKETISAINTATLVRFNDGDDIGDVTGACVEQEPAADTEGDANDQATS